MKSSIKKILKDLQGETVSILLSIPKKEGGKKKETYNGIIDKVVGDFLVLDPNNPDFHIKKLILKVELVISIWVYKEGWKKGGRGK